MSSNDDLNLLISVDEKMMSAARICAWLAKEGDEEDVREIANNTFKRLLPAMMFLKGKVQKLGIDAVDCVLSKESSL